IITVFETSFAFIRSSSISAEASSGGGCAPAAKGNFGSCFHTCTWESIIGGFAAARTAVAATAVARNVRRCTCRSMYHATTVTRSASKCGMSEIHALAASEVKGRLKPFSYDPGPLGDEQVELEVLYCGICHSDVAMLNNEWGFSRYPLVPGHEVIGRVVEMGSGAKLVGKGQIVGLGWNSGSCLHCRQCLTGDHNMCESLEQ